MEYVLPFAFPLCTVMGAWTAWVVSQFDWVRDRRRVSGQGDRKAAPSGLATFIAVVVTIMWAYSVVSDINDPRYDVPLYVHLIFAGIVGSIYGFKVVQGVHRGKEDDE